MKLKYVGKGTFVEGIPARDLTDEEVEKHGLERLLAIGIYEKPVVKKKKKKKESDEWQE